MRASVFKILLLLFCFTVTACGGGGGSGGGTNPPPTANNPPDADTGALSQPVAKAGPDISVNEGTAFTLNGSGTDPENDALTFKWTLPAGFSAEDLTTAALRVTQTPDVIANAQFTFSLKVTDSKGNSATDSAAVTLQFVNRPPTAGAGSDAEHMEGTQFTLPGGFVEPDGQSVDFRWTVPAGFTVADETAKDLVITGTPDVAAVTVYPFDFMVTDTGGLSHTDNVMLTLTRDSVPDAFSFAPVRIDNAAPNYPIESSAITPSGFEVAVSISVTNAEYSINGGAWTNAAGEIAPGQSVKLRVKATASSETVATLNINGVSTTSTVAGADPAFALTTSPQTLNFSWAAMTGPDHYNIEVAANGGGAFTPFSDNIAANTVSEPVQVHRHNWNEAAYLLEGCNADESFCTSITQLNTTPADSVAAITYVKPITDGDGDGDTDSDFNRFFATGRFGDTMAISRDGTVLVIGAFGDDSNAAGINQPRTNSLVNSGAVHVHPNTSLWRETDFLKASNPGANDFFGTSVAINATGTVIAVGAINEDLSGAEETYNDGAVYIFEETLTGWQQAAYIKSPNPTANDHFGLSVALSANGQLLAVGVPFEDGSGTTLVGSAYDDSALSRGAIYTFRKGTTWGFEHYIKPNVGTAEAYFGYDVALNADGTVLAVGAKHDSDNSSGIDAPNNNTFSNRSGTVYVLKHDGATWTRSAYIKAPINSSGANFGASVALDTLGTRLVVGEPLSPPIESGRAYIYDFDDGSNTWKFTAELSAPNAAGGDRFGSAIAINGTYNSLAGAGASDAIMIGAASSSTVGEDGSTRGVQADIVLADDDLASGAGAIYSYRLDPVAGWQFDRYIKAMNTDAEDAFGAAIAVDGSGDTLTVGAPYEDGGIGDINASDGSSDTEANSGAVYIY